MRGANPNFERYMRREVLGSVSTPLVWALDEIDRLFAFLSPLLTFGPGTGLQQLNGVTVFCVLLQLTDGTTGVTRSEVICFQEGKFFFARTPDLVAQVIEEQTREKPMPHIDPVNHGYDGPPARSS